MSIRNLVVGTLAWIAHRWVALIVAAAFAVGLRNLLTGSARFAGDPEVWYGLFHFFAEGLYKGHLNLWNPYMNGGEPYWPAIGLFRVIDPLNIGFTLLGKFLGLSIFYTYHLQFVAKIAVTVVGTYYLLKRLLGSKEVALLISVLFGHYFFSVLLYDAYYMAFCWVPFILLFVVRFLETHRISDLAWAVFLLALYVGGGNYHIALGTFYILVFAICCMIFSTRTEVRESFRPLAGRKIFLILAFLSLGVSVVPVLSTLVKASSDMHPIARTAADRALFEAGKSVGTSYDDLMREGSVVEPLVLVDYIASYPSNRGTEMVNLQPLTLLLGIFLLIGLASNTGIRWKPHFLILTVVAMFALVGHHTPVHELFWYLYWPLRFVRNTMIFLPFVLLGLSFFVGLGLLQFRSKFPAVGTWTTRIITSLFLVYVATGVDYFATRDYFVDYAPDFSHGRLPASLPGPRVFAIPRTGWYLYEPVLYKTNAALNMIATPPADIRAEDLPYFKAWDALVAPNRFGAVVGLRSIFWTKRYYDIYKLGERDVDAFNALMGVGQPVLGFRAAHEVLSEKELQEFIQQKGGRALQELLDQRVVLAAEPGLKPRAQNAPTAPSKFSFDVDAYLHGTVRFRVNVPREGFVIYWDGFDDDWIAHVNGAERPIYRANIGFKAVAVSPEDRTIEFAYRPRWFLAGVFGYWILPAVFLLAMLWRERATQGRARNDALRGS